MLPFLIVAAIAIPAFLLGPLVSMLIPLVAGTLQSLAGKLLGRVVNWQTNVSPIVGEAVNLVVSLLFAKLLVGLGLSVSDGTLNCLHDPATKIAASCVDASTIGTVITYALTWLASHIGLKTANAHVAWKRASIAERSAGVGRGG